MNWIGIGTNISPKFLNPSSILFTNELIVVQSETTFLNHFYYVLPNLNHMVDVRQRLDKLCSNNMSYLQS